MKSVFRQLTIVQLAFLKSNIFVKKFSTDFEAKIGQGFDLHNFQLENMTFIQT